MTRIVRSGPSLLPARRADARAGKRPHFLAWRIAPPRGRALRSPGAAAGARVLVLAPAAAAERVVSSLTILALGTLR